MYLFILKPREDLQKDDNPWKPWYDKCFGFVVRAENEESAREIAQDNAHDEKRNEFFGRKESNTTEPWLNPQYSTCTVLELIGPSELILSDVHHA